MSIESWIDDPMSILQPDDAPIFADFAAARTSTLFQAALKAPPDPDFFKECTKATLLVMKTCCDNQLVDFLTGKFSVEPEESASRSVTGTPLNNIQCERDFGFLDSSQQRRRHATFHYHTSILLLKQSRTDLKNWLDNKTEQETSELFQDARKGGRKLRTSHQDFEKKTASTLQEKLKEKKRGKGRIENGGKTRILLLLNALLQLRDNELLSSQSKTVSQRFHQLQNTRVMMKTTLIPEFLTVMDLVSSRTTGWLSHMKMAGILVSFPHSSFLHVTAITLA
jgi:hypothetical protein